MMGGEQCQAWRSDDELVVLHTVRLTGFASTEAVGFRAGLPSVVVDDQLRILERERFVERMDFADSGGWILTELGKTHDTELLQEDVEASGARPLLEDVVRHFEPVNADLVRVITEWQLSSTAEQAVRRGEVHRQLTELADALVGLMVGLTARMQRFRRYPLQFSTALQQARAGNDQWIAGVGLLSCHTVWAELHQDLLSSLGVERSAEPRHGRG